VEWSWDTLTRIAKLLTLDTNGNPNKSSSDPFSYGITAMAVTQLWYLCCVHPADSWDVAALPSYQGVVHGHIDADTIRILKSSENPAAAFEVMKYLIGPVSSRLLAAYSGMPARTADQEAFFDTQKSNSHR
jgi:ABC-type glycerol-3-phosphate transport system substrate-binding protein